MSLTFNPETVKSIGYYVYVLVDPLGNIPFYIGKGSGNRVFSHVNLVVKKGPNPSDAKELYIESILKRKDPNTNYVIHYIVRYGLTSEHALLIESVLIDIFNGKLNVNLNGANGLTNIYGGFYSDNGCVVAKDLDKAIISPKAQLDRTKKYLAININSLPTGPNAQQDIYQKVRWCWVLSPARANQADYILATHAGVIVGVYKLDSKGWQEVPNQHPSISKKRYFFDQDFSANLSQERSNLIGCSLSKKTRGAQNPIWYVCGW